MAGNNAAPAAKVFVVGLDGATWDNILPLVRRGELPVFADLLKSGSWGSLRSTVPCVTPPAWASFLTGTSPGWHGILDFTIRTDTEEQHIATVKAIGVPRIWDVLSHFGRRSVFLNVPFTYPPSSFEGIIVPGPPVPPGKFVTHPPELAEEIFRRIPDYSPDLVRWQKHEIPDEINRVTESRRELTTWMMRANAWDFFMVTFIATDRLHHKMWHMEEAVAAYYRRLDAVIGEILGNLDSDTYVLFVSDHGFTDGKGDFFLNQWLSENGFLTMVFRRHRDRPPSCFNPSIGRRQTRGKVKGFHRLLRLLPGFSDLGWLIDLPRTRAFVGIGHFPGVFVNMKGRYEWGAVSPEDYEAVRDELIDSLSTICTPSGERLFERVARREDAFDGPHVERMPDVVCELGPRGLELRNSLGVPNVFRKFKKKKGVHDPDGLFLVKGPGIRADHEVDGTRIEDVTPLILFLMGLPQLSCMSGTLPRQVLDDSLGEREVSVIPADEIGYEPEESNLSEEEEEAIRRELKQLGYM